MFSVSGISSVWATKSVSPVDGNVFVRPSSDDSQNLNGSADGTGRRSKDDEPALGTGKGDGAKGGAKGGARKLKPAELHEVQELAERDRQVRAHEAAHQAAAGGLGGAASFTYETGPDGKTYAVGGEVPVDMSGGRSPEETIARATQIRAAALAPADPSPQDLAVAADAAAMEAAARQELARQQLAAFKAAAVTARASAPTQAAGRAVAIHGAGAHHDQAAQGTMDVASTPVVADVSGQVAATTSALQIDLPSAGPTLAQVQHLAQLASAAYQSVMART